MLRDGDPKLPLGSDEIIIVILKSCEFADRAAVAILRVVESDAPPARLLLGTDAVRVVEEARAAFDEDVERWRALSASTDYGAAPA